MWFGKNVRDGAALLNMKVIDKKDLWG